MEGDGLKKVGISSMKIDAPEYKNLSTIAASCRDPMLNNAAILQLIILIRFSYNFV